MQSAVCGSSKFTGTRTCCGKVGVALKRYNACALHSSNPWHTTRVALLGSATAIDRWGMALCKPVDGRILCIHTHTKQGCGFHALADIKVRLQKVGVAKKERISALLHLHIMYSLISRRTWSNLDQTIIFKAGLTQMTWTKCEPVDLDDPPSFNAAIYSTTACTVCYS